MNDVLVLSCANTGGGGGGGTGLKINAWVPGRGAIQRTYSSEAEGGGAALVMLGKSHILCAMKTLPFIYVWHVKKEQVTMKIACPGLVRTLAITPDNVYCAAGIAEKIYIWQVSTGHLLAVKAGHYQSVSVLIFTDDGQWLVSGGDDGRVLVWSLRRLLSEAFDSSDVTLPLSSTTDTMATKGPHPPALHNSWSDHALPITSVYCGCGGLQSRLATASLDQTCKLYDMASGQLLCSLLFGFSLTAVAMDTAEQWLFVGGSMGKMARINLMLQRTAPSHTQSVETDSNMAFKGHTQAVVSLGVCEDGLVSSSEDGTCRVWDVSSGQTTRLLQMKGGVVQSQLVWGVTVSGRKSAPDYPTISIAPFQKQLWYNNQDAAGEEASRIILHRTINPLADLNTMDQTFDLDVQLPSANGSNNQPEEEEEEEAMTIHKLREDMTQLRDINRTLYSLLAKKTSHLTTATIPQTSS